MVLSVDNIVIDFFLLRPSYREKLSALLSHLPAKYNIGIASWTSKKPGTFREQTSIRLPDGRSFWIGAALNGVTTSWGRCRVEFNPNKVGSCDVLHEVLSFLMGCTDPVQREVVRFDLAIDLPIPREHCLLVKDKRLYIERRHGKEITQYLGAKSSSTGRVKLYNKRLESKLDYDLTRLELTIDPSVPFSELAFPIVYFWDASKLSLNKVRITDTERYIIGAFLNGYGSLGDLGRKTKQKIQLLLDCYIQCVTVDPQDYAAIIDQVNSYL